MMEFREIGKDDIELLRQAIEFERAFPDFFHDVTETRTATESDILKFYHRCAFLYGLFEAEEFVGLIYLEAITPEILEVHLDLKRGTDPKPLVKIIEAVRDRSFRRGYSVGISWTIRQHRGLRKILNAAGFDETGLTLRQGHSHGRVLQWVQMAVVRQASASA